MWGLYGTTPLAALASSLDLYTFGFEDSDAHYAQLSGQERRYTVGARIFGAAQGFDWDNEAARQFGSAEQRDIRASVGVGARRVYGERLALATALRRQIGIASGDKTVAMGSSIPLTPCTPSCPT